MWRKVIGRILNVIGIVGVILLTWELKLSIRILVWISVLIIEIGLALEYRLHLYDSLIKGKPKS